MTVSYSLFANAGYQFFDNNGQMLSGGKLYTYLAGTNTNLTTYNSSSGTVANSNPIILDSSGRLTSEIWVTIGVSSKYVLKSSANVLIATWDNIPSLSTSLNGSGTANGVAYFNSINQFTSGANLTFDGNNLVASGSVTAGSSVAVGTNITVGGNATVTGTIAATGGITSATPAVTQSASDSSTKIATTEFVKKYAPSAKIQTINATVASNQLTVSLSPTYLDFRASPVTSNAITSVYASPADLIVPFGTTLGMTNGVSARLVILACLNGSTVQLAITNLSGGNQLDETNVITTSTSGSLTSSIFSSSIISNVPYRVVGFIDITCATAGTWASAPTEIQGAGGLAMSSLSASSQIGQNVVLYTANTSWVVPVGVTKCIVYAVGGGGGGYGAPTSGATAININYCGGNGGYISAAITGLTSGAVISVNIGAGGNAYFPSGSPTNGGNTTFGSYVTAYGGLATNYYSGGGSTDSGSAYASSGGVIVTPLRQITNTCGVTTDGLATPHQIYKNYYAGIPYFGGIPIGQFYLGSGGASPDLRTAWDKTTIYPAGSAGGAWSSGGTYSSGFGVAGALVIQY